MNLSVGDLVLFALFIITILTLVSKIHQPTWVYVYAVVSLSVLKLFSLF